MTAIQTETSSWISAASRGRAAADDTPAETADLWNTGQIRARVLGAVRHQQCGLSCVPWDAGDCVTDHVMDIIRDVLGVTAQAQYESAARAQQACGQLRARLAACEAGQ